MNSTTDNDDIWKGDLLGRKSEAIYLQRYLENIYANTNPKEPSFVLNINSKWGHGKTWFIERFAKLLKINHPVVYFNAWENDFTKDALLSFVSVICSDLELQFRADRKIASKVKNIKDTFSFYFEKTVPILLATAVKQATGMSLSFFEGPTENDKKLISEGTADIAKAVSSCAIESFTKAKAGIDQFKAAINKLTTVIKESKKVQLPIFVFVDELDRCRPTYAIELLESIKHLFGTSGIFFVVATDTKQLSHSVKAIYGNEFSALAYLKRFFYAEYQLAEPNYENMANFLFKDLNVANKLFLPEPLLSEYGFNGFFALTARFFDFTVREQEQVFNTLRTILLSSQNEDLHYIYLLFLICLRNKIENFSAINCNQPNLNEILTNSNVFPNQTTIVSLFHEEEDSKNKKHKLRDVFLFYCSLLNENVSDHKIAGHYEYQNNITSFLRSKFNRRRHNELLTYFDLISQAGRITVN